MKLHLFLAFLFATNICLQENGITHIIFEKDHVTQSQEKTAIDGTTVVIEQPGVFHVSGESEEGVIVIKSNSVKLQLENLKLSSKKTAPIIVTNTLKDIEIINKGITILNDNENKRKTEGECAVIKVKRNSVVSFQNEGILKLNGECKHIIKGGPESSIIFKKSYGEYLIRALKTAIESDGLLEFNGGVFDIESTDGDAIKSQPEDPISSGKILVNDGTFKIHCFNDAFSAKNNITIVKGAFDIITQEGYDSETYNETESSKAFKVTNNETGCEIKIYSGDFNINSADDAFRSNRDITIISGKFTIQTKDDGICAKYNLVLGKKNAPLDDLYIKILDSYEAIEGMTISIYSGRIVGNADNDGINASGLIRKQRRSPGNWNDSKRNHSEWNRTERNRSRDDQWGSQRVPGSNKTHIGAPPNDSCIVRIYGGEIYLYTNSDGIDTNGHIYVHGGSINIFSEGKGANEPIDHNGNFTLFNAEILGIGTGGLEFVHEGIKKGNEMYGFFFGMITKNKKLEIFDDNNKLVKEGYITKDITYIFYTSLKLNENYTFYVIDEIKNNRTKLEVTYKYPEEGEDDEDELYIKDINYSKCLKTTIIGILIFLVLL